MLLKYVVRRVLATIPVVIGVTLITFSLMHATAQNYIPGVDLNPALKPEDIEAIKRYLGLDRPLYVQYLTWLVGITHGDFGRSMIDGRTVSSHILDRLPPTLQLTVPPIVPVTAISIPLAVTA